MMGRTICVGACTAFALIAASRNVSALNSRINTVQKGDFVLIGNTLAHDCGPLTPPPIVGMTSCSIAGDLNDPAPDVFWFTDGSGPSTSANASISAVAAKSGAVLDLPANASVTHAFLYWSARKKPSPPTGNATLAHFPDAPITAQAVSILTTNNSIYHAVADVTDYVTTQGSGTYVVGDIDAAELNNNQPATDGYAGWWMVVLYTAPDALDRRLALFDGLDALTDGAETKVNISNLTINEDLSPTRPATLGVVAYDGDVSITGDQVFVGATPLKDLDGTGDPLNFFNGTRASSGAPLSVAGDLPQLSGAPGSMIRLDIDRVTISSLLPAGTSSVDIRAVSMESIYVAGIIASIPTSTGGDVPPACTGDHPACGPENNGKVCSGDGLCVDGCRTAPGSGCPQGMVCLLADPADSIGYCESGAGGIPGGGGDVVIYDGCICGVPSGRGGSHFAGAIAVSAAAIAGLRRIQRASRRNAKRSPSC